MNTVIVRTKALNSLIFIHGLGAKDVPLIDGVGACWATAGMIAISCLPDCDGETEIRVGKLGEVSPVAVAVFDGDLKTPNRRVVLSDVNANKIVDVPVLAAVTRVKIWTTGRQDTDVVVVGLR